MTGASALGQSALPPSPQNDKGLADSITPSNRMARIDRSKADPKAVEAAEGMEGMFLDYMMKVMRSTVPKNDMDLSNTGTDVYQSMLDSEYAQKAVHAGGVGLADQILAYLDSNRYASGQGSAGRGTTTVAQGAQSAHGNPAAPAPAARDRDTGGIHEGQ